MKLNYLSLKNIRSYKDLSLVFKEGTTLLSGDIGSGKTTILLSLEFALFGIIRGSLSGGSLLRKGSKEGEVILNFEIDNKNITIFRTLKKSGSGVNQASGHIDIDGERLEATRVELTSEILAFLGYPDMSLTKSKALIYRYTVYTPQEEMRQILFDSPDVRL